MRFQKFRVRLFMLLIAMCVIIFAGYACDPPAPPSNGCDNSGGFGGATGGNVDVFSKGPYSTAQSLNSGPSRRSGVFYPRDIAGESGPFPVFVFGCGAGTGPNAYTSHGSRIASHGFIVIINASDNQGRMNKTAIDWIIEQNDNRQSPFFGKVNTGKIAAGGHSLGSLGTFNMAREYSGKLTTTVHVAGGSGGSGPRNLSKPTIYISGTTDMALSPTRNDYRNTKVPVFFTVMQGVGHIYAAREGLPAIIAWLRWHLYDETERSGDFLNAGGTFTTGKWDSQSKNW